MADKHFLKKTISYIFSLDSDEIDSVTNSVIVILETNYTLDEDVVM